MIIYAGIEINILPMLSYLDYHVKDVHWLYLNLCTWTSSDVIVCHSDIITLFCISAFSGT